MNLKHSMQPSKNFLLQSKRKTLFQFPFQLILQELKLGYL